MNSQAVLLNDEENFVSKTNIEMKYSDRNYDEEEDREKWTNKMDFIFSCIGYAIGVI